MTARAKLKLGFLFAVIFGLSAIAVIYAYIHRNEETTDDASIDAPTVIISAKVGGYVKKLNVTDNQMVKAGDVLLEIDPDDYINRRDFARAELEAAQAAANASFNNMEVVNISAPSNLEAAQFQVASAQATLERAVSDLKRLKSLTSEARSQAQLDEAIANEKTARSALNDAMARVRTAETAPKTIAAAQATNAELAAKVKQAEANLAQAEKDLADTKVIAPIDGRITKRSVEQGDYIQPGEQLSALVGNNVWVVANFKEVQLEHMRPHQHAKITIDAFPGVTLTGTIDSIQSGTGARFSAFPPENATGNFVKIVQRVPVKIVFDKSPDPALLLGPGMSVVPVVYTDN